ncbi:hypothetical protein Dimus_032195 [Dionaea muscipula]
MEIRVDKLETGYYMFQCKPSYKIVETRCHIKYVVVTSAAWNFGVEVAEVLKKPEPRPRVVLTDDELALKRLLTVFCMEELMKGIMEKLRALYGSTTSEILEGHTESPTMSKEARPTSHKELQIADSASPRPTASTSASGPRLSHIAEVLANEEIIQPPRVPTQHEKEQAPTPSMGTDDDDMDAPIGRSLKHKKSVGQGPREAKPRKVNTQVAAETKTDTATPREASQKSFRSQQDVDEIDAFFDSLPEVCPTGVPASSSTIPSKIPQQSTDMVQPSLLIALVSAEEQTLEKEQVMRKDSVATADDVIPSPSAAGVAPPSPSPAAVTTARSLLRR